MISLTPNDFDIKIEADERDDGNIALFVNGNEMPSVQEAAIVAGVESYEIELELIRRGLPVFRFESQMLHHYAIVM